MIYTTFALGIGVASVVLLLLATAGLFRGRYTRSHTPPTLFSREARALFALFGFVLLAAVGWATWSNANRTYELVLQPGKTRSHEVVVPETVLTPQDWENNLRRGVTATSTGTLHLKCILARRHPSYLLPHEVLETSIPVRKFSAATQLRFMFSPESGFPSEVTVTPLALLLQNRDGTQTLCLHASAFLDRGKRGGAQHRDVSATSGFFDLRGKCLGRFHDGAEGLSLGLANSATAPQWELWLSGEVATGESALKRVPFEPYWDQGEPGRRAESGFVGGQRRSFRADEGSAGIHTPAPGIRMVEHLGYACLLVLMAAGFLSAAFRRQATAFCILTLLGVLYLGALDSLILGKHMNLARGKGQPLEARLIGINEAKRTFFFAKTATRQIKAIADDKDEVPLVRTSAQARLAASYY